MKINKGSLIKNTIWLMVLLLVLCLLTVYLSWAEGLKIIRWVLDLAIILTALSLILCSYTRLRGFLPADGKPVVIKNRPVLLGSIVFHLAMVVLLMGFLMNVLWGIKGVVLIPEGVTVRVPVDLQIIQKGPFVTTPTTSFMRLEGFSYGEETDRSGKPLLRPVGRVLVQDDAGERQQQLKINQPISVGKFKFIYRDSGYSLLFNITGPMGTLVDDYANIASHQGNSWSDKVPISPERQLDIRFFPDFAEGNSKSYTSKSRFPNNPVVELAIIERGRTIGRAVIPMGQTRPVGGLKASFQGYRYWVILDGGSDPGRPVILLAALLAVCGLAWRIKGIFGGLEDTEIDNT